MQDIAGLIERDCTRYRDDGDVQGGAGSHVTVDKTRRYQLLYRYNYIRHSLRPFGYDFNIHPQFAARLVHIGLHILFRIYGRNRFVQTGFRLYPQTGFGFMLLK